VVPTSVGGVHATLESQQARIVVEPVCGVKRSTSPDVRERVVWAEPGRQGRSSSATLPASEQLQERLDVLLFLFRQHDLAPNDTVGEKEKVVLLQHLIEVLRRVVVEVRRRILHPP
jgi:hypothetical protein